MTMIQINWRPGDRQLRQFGFLALVALPAAGWVILGRPWPAELLPIQIGVLAGLAVLGSLAALAAAVRPQSLRVVFVGLSILALPIGLVVSEIMLLALYYLLFVPVGIGFRLIGRDALERRIDRSASSYWRPKAPPAGVEGYFRQS
jgi:hypothetical protein